MITQKLERSCRCLSSSQVDSMKVDIWSDYRKAINCPSLRTWRQGDKALLLRNEIPHIFQQPNKYVKDAFVFHKVYFCPRLIVIIVRSLTMMISEHMPKLTQQAQLSQAEAPFLVHSSGIWHSERKIRDVWVRLFIRFLFPSSVSPACSPKDP